MRSVDAGYLLALGVTLVLELPVVMLLFRSQWKRLALSCLVATAMTHWLMHFIVPLITSSYLSYLIVGESFATFGEGLAYGVAAEPTNFIRGLMASALANGLSYGVGLFVSPLWQSLYS